MSDIPTDEAVMEGIEEPDDSPPVAPPEPEQEEVTTLTDEERQAFKSFLTIGKLTKTFSLFGFDVSIETLNCDDEIRVGRFAQGHQGSQAFARAYQVGTVAAALRSVDGEKWDIPIYQNATPQDLFDKRLERVQVLYPFVVTSIYKEVIALESEFGEMVAKLGKPQG